MAESKLIESFIATFTFNEFLYDSDVDLMEQDGKRYFNVRYNCLDSGGLIPDLQLDPKNYTWSSLTEKNKDLVKQVGARICAEYALRGYLK